MQLQLTESHVVYVVGAVFAALAGVVGRYAWKVVNRMQKGETAIGWTSIFGAIALSAFGITNWSFQTGLPQLPKIEPNDTTTTVSAKMQDYEIRKSQFEATKAEAVLPISVAAPMTFLGIPLAVLGLLKILSGHQTRNQLDIYGEFAVRSECEKMIAEMGKKCQDALAATKELKLELSGLNLPSRVSSLETTVLRISGASDGYGLPANFPSPRRS